MLNIKNMMVLWGKLVPREYCDDFALSLRLCGEGINTWPAHAWFVGYEPADDPEIAVVALNNGREGSTFRRRLWQKCWIPEAAERD